MALLPLGVLAVKLAQFDDGGVEVAFVAISIAQVVADGSFLGRKPLGFAIFGDGLLELVLFVQDERKIGMSFPEGRLQMKGMAIGGDGGGQISIGVQSDAQVVVGIGVIGIAGKRLVEGMNRRGVLSVGIQSQPEELVGLGVLWIHAERGTSFGDGVGSVI